MSWGSTLNVVKIITEYVWRLMIVPLDGKRVCLCKESGFDLFILWNGAKVSSTLYTRNEGNWRIIFMHVSFNNMVNFWWWVVLNRWVDGRSRNFGKRFFVKSVFCLFCRKSSVMRCFSPKLFHSNVFMFMMCVVELATTDTPQQDTINFFCVLLNATWIEF